MRSLAMKIAISLCLLLPGIASAQQDPVDFPSSPSGQLLKLLLESLNSGDESKWTEFIADHWKPSEDPQMSQRRLGLFRMVYDDTRGLLLHDVMASDDLSISALLKVKEPQAEVEWVDFTLYVDSTDTGKVAMVSVREGEDPKYRVPDVRLSDSEIVEFLDMYIGDLVADDQFSGTVLIARDGKPFYKRVHGVACKRYDVPNRIDTRFNLGSMNKMFTGVAIMQLMEQGKLSLDDKVGKYLPDIPRKEIADKVTIHQLLTHTSGMQDYWEEMFDGEFWRIKSVSQLAELVFDDSLLFEPGTDFHYSNSGPIVLGLIIEKVSGMDYFDYIHDNIYESAGMIGSGCFEVDTPVENVAIGYTKAGYDGEILPPGVWHNNFFMHAVKGGPAGGGYSTVEDLLAFDQALRNNILMSRESFELMTTGRVDRNADVSYAYLIQDQQVNGQRIIGHAGGAPGINAMLDMYLDSGYTVAVMANYDGAAVRVGRKIRELLTE
jgi:CubicO group peptidase (beta-lactamase class C family)